MSCLSLILPGIAYFAHRTSVCLGLLSLLAALLPGRGRADEPAATLILRFPAASATQIAFAYANDIWLVPRAGGTAIPLSSPPGPELFPRFSPDGQTIAFSADYDGTLDVYTLPVGGGIPKRLTYEPGAEIVQGWSPDGRVLFLSSEQTPYKGTRLFYASPTGGIPEALPLYLAASCSFSADSKQLAYMPWSTEDATWNRYEGGLAPDIWLYDFTTGKSTQLTDWPGTDAEPMLFGNQLYYLSDAGPEHRRNIWVDDLASGAKQQVTHFAAFETKFPSAGPDCIVLENGGQLYLLSVPGHELTAVKVQLPGDRRQLRPQTSDVGGDITEASFSPSGKRIAVNAHGDIWTLPAEHGFPRNLTRTDGTAERSPAWSPDGKSVAFFSDASGEYQLCVRAADGSGDIRQLTHGLAAFLYNPVWSPDSTHIAFSDKASTLYLCEVSSGQTTRLDQDPWVPGPGVQCAWSPDSQWLAYEISDDATANTYLKLYSVKQKKASAVTSPMFSSGTPSFDKGGQYLYFLTARRFSPEFSEVDDPEDFLFTNAVYPAVLPLQADLPSPFAPENDEELGPAAAAAAADAEVAPPATKPLPGGKEAPGKAKPRPGVATKEELAEELAGLPLPPPVTRVDFSGIEQRAVPLPVPAGGYSALAASAGSVYYLRGTAGGDPDAPTAPSLFVFDLKEKKETLLRTDVDSFELSADATLALIRSGGQAFVIHTEPDAPPPDAPVSTAGMLAEVNPRAEWRELVHDAWRIYRDFFYDPNMHGVDWPAQLTRAEKLVDTAATREDVDYIISEMVSELNTSHTYVIPGYPSEEAPQASVGELGCDFAAAKDAAGRPGIKFAHIYRGADWEPEVQGPLSQPGTEVHEGEFLLAVNGLPIDPAQSPYALLQGKAGMAAKLTVGPNAVHDAEARDVLVTPVADDAELRLRSWIEANRKYVADKTAGRVGYIYVRDTFVPGLIDLQRQFSGQFMKDGLIIDERWNGGGFLPYRFVELLNRPVRNYWARRDGKSLRTPFHAHIGPKVMLINEHAGSGGDAFPYYFRQSGLGKLIGTRTWGGLVGYAGNPELMDGSGITVPSFGIYTTTGEWAIEGHGVDPDIPVVNDEADLARGVDKQLDAGIGEVLTELQTNCPTCPPKPAYPNRSGMGDRAPAVPPPPAARAPAPAAGG